MRLGEDALGYVDVLHNFARYLSGTSADAEDLVQETYACASGCRSVHDRHEPQGLALPNPPEHLYQPMSPGAQQPGEGGIRYP